MKTFFYPWCVPSFPFTKRIIETINIMLYIDSSPHEVKEENLDYIFINSS